MTITLPNGLEVPKHLERPYRMRNHARGRGLFWIPPRLTAPVVTSGLHDTSSRFMIWSRGGLNTPLISVDSYRGVRAIGSVKINGVWEAVIFDERDSFEVLWSTGNYRALEAFRNIAPAHQQVRWDAWLEEDRS